MPAASRWLMGIDVLPQRADYVAMVARLRSDPSFDPGPTGSLAVESGKGFELVDEAETKDGSRQPSNALLCYALRRDGPSSRWCTGFLRLPQIPFWP